MISGLLCIVWSLLCLSSSLDVFSLGCAVLCGRRRISLLVWPWFWLDLCLLFGRFSTAPSSFTSNPRSIFGFGRVVLLSDGLLSDLPWQVRSCCVLCGGCCISLLVLPWFGLHYASCLDVSFRLPILVKTGYYACNRVWWLHSFFTLQCLS